MHAEKPKIDLATAKPLLTEHRETIREAFKRAVREALLQHKRAGNPVAVSENGQVVWIAPEQINLETSE